MMSLVPAMTRLTEEARGIVTFDGNEVRVLKMWAPHVSQIHMV